MRNVLGSSPSPASVNLAKRLYQRPSGTSGSDSSQCFSSTKSSIEIRPSRNRSIRWSRIPRGGGFRSLGILELFVENYSFNLLG